MRYYPYFDITATNPPSLGVNVRPSHLPTPIYLILPVCPINHSAIHVVGMAYKTATVIHGSPFKERPAVRPILPEHFEPMCIVRVKGGQLYVENSDIGEFS